MSTHFKTIIFVLGVMLGIVSGELSHSASELAILFLVLGVMQTILFFLGRKFENSERKLFKFSLALVMVLFSFGFFIGTIRSQLVEEKVPYVCESVCTFEGEVLSSPQSKDAYQILIVRPSDRDRQTLDVQVRAALYPKYKIGETLRLSGKVKIPDIIPPHGDAKSFDYGAYLLTQNVGSEMVYPKIEIVDESAYGVENNLGIWKEGMVSKMSLYVSSPATTLASGMLFGTSELSKELTQTFRVAGLSHIIVLSGFNIAIVIATVLFLLRFLPLLFRIGTASVIVVLFVLMVGASASVLRATVMAFIALLATVVGRSYVAKQALIISFLTIILYQPYSLLHDVSLHLSFLATVGIVYLTIPIEKCFRRINSDSFREACTTTVSAYVATLPYICYTFGKVSVYALLANVIVLPFVPSAMLFSALTVLSSYVSTSFALVFGFTTTLIIDIIISIAGVIEYLPFSYLSFTVSFLSMCLLYVLIFLGAVYFSKKEVDETCATKQDGILTDVISY